MAHNSSVHALKTTPLGAHKKKNFRKILRHFLEPSPHHLLQEDIAAFNFRINIENLFLRFLSHSLDIVIQLRHSWLVKMKTFSIFRRQSRSNHGNKDSQIRVYRSHAARAISEERWEVAEIFIDRILNVDPHHTEAWLMKGHLRHHCREDEQTAVDCYRKVINLCGPDSGHPHAQRARTSLGRLLSVWS